MNELEGMLADAERDLKVLAVASAVVISLLVATAYTNHAESEERVRELEAKLAYYQAIEAGRPVMLSRCPK